MSPRVVSVEWSQGASPEGMVDAFGEEALNVAVLAALLEDPHLREKAMAALRNPPPGDATNP